MGDPEAPIGMLDSGVGGLWVARAVRALLPSELILYVGDTAHFPYGTRAAEDVLACVRGVLGFLAREGVKAVVLACNTASAVALPRVAEEAPFPVIGVIEAGVRLAGARTARGVVGVLATERTIASGAYERAMARSWPGVRVVGQAAPRLVELVEKNAAERDPRLLHETLLAYLRPLVAGGVDTVILGCTHFLSLAGRVRAFYPRLEVIDPARETARELRELLLRQGMARLGNGAVRHRFLVTGPDEAAFSVAARRLWPEGATDVERLPGHAGPVLN